MCVSVWGSVREVHKCVDAHALLMSAWVYVILQNTIQTSATKLITVSEFMCTPGG